MLQKIKQLDGNLNKLDFILKSIYDGHENLSIRMNIFGQLNPLKSMKIDDKMEILIDDLLGYYVYTKKSGLNENEFVKTALHDIFGYIKNDESFKFKSKKHSNYLKEI